MAQVFKLFFLLFRPFFGETLSVREKVSHYRRDCTYNVVGGECEDFHKNVVDDRKVKRTNLSEL